jgi:pre-mRNA-splicing helicase BRR2
LRQFKGIPCDVLDKIERKDIQWERYFELSASELGELIHLPKLGKNLFRIIHLFPKLEVEAQILPITRHVIKLNLIVTPDFIWDNRVHDCVEPFWIFVEDADSNYILHCEYLIIYAKYVSVDHTITFTVPVSEPLPPQYFVKLISDKWLQSEIVLPVSFRNLILPEKLYSTTELLDLQPLPISALENTKFELLYHGRFKRFNPIQTQVFTSLYNSDHNVLLAAPTGSGKTLCIEFAILRAINKALEKNDILRCAYVAPYESVCVDRYHDWSTRFGGQLGLNVVTLKGETEFISNTFEHCNIIISQPLAWDFITRRWKQRRNIKLINLYIIDELQIIASDKGHIIEIITSRMRYMSSQIEGHFCRIIAMSASLANAKDLGRWCGANSHSFYNFPQSVRPVPLQIEIRGFGLMNLDSKINIMIKPAYDVILQRCSFRTKPAIIFVPPKFIIQVSKDFSTLVTSYGLSHQFLKCPFDEIKPCVTKLNDSALKNSLQYGIGYVHENQSVSDRRIVEALYNSGTIQVLVVSCTMCWNLTQSSHLVIIMGTQLSEGTEYPITDLLNMIGKANRPNVDENSFCLLMCNGPRKEYYMSSLLDSFPIESCINYFLHDHLNSEIVTGTIEDKQEAVDYLTWTFYYIRLPLNPNYYGLVGNSHRHVSDHLSELVESTIEDLTRSGCIITDDDNINLNTSTN